MKEKVTISQSSHCNVDIGWAPFLYYLRRYIQEKKKKKAPDNVGCSSSCNDIPRYLLCTLVYNVLGLLRELS